jgi:predicted NBD/HSP70 family sugar kinase
MEKITSDVLALGIDLGGTKILTAVVNPRGEMLARDHSVTPAAQKARLLEHKRAGAMILGPSPAGRIGGRGAKTFLKKD